MLIMKFKQLVAILTCLFEGVRTLHEHVGCLRVKWTLPKRVELNQDDELFFKSLSMNCLLESISYFEKV